MLGLLLACAEPEWTEAERVAVAGLTPIPPPYPRPTNRVADDPAAAALGARLFVDPGFSSGGTVSCATCHDPGRHFTDGRPVARTDAGTGTRNTPTVETVAWSTWYFWDGRADSAWAQAGGPLLNPIEHAFTAEAVRARVAEVYAAEWAAIFGGVSEDPARVLAEVGKALEAFERTVGPRPGRFDAWAAELAAGRESAILTAQERRGLELFIGPAGCVNCHNGPLFTDHSFHNLGLPDNHDRGRADGAVTVLADPANCLGAHADGGPCDELRFLDPDFEDWPGAMKTPSLRNVAGTAPYMHDGRFATLEEVVDFYNLLPLVHHLGHRELILKPLRLTDGDRAALVAFLGTLTGEG